MKYRWSQKYQLQEDIIGLTIFLEHVCEKLVFFIRGLFVMGLYCDNTRRK